MKHIVVVGCGVVGLTTAYILVEKGYHVTIVATWFPGDRGANYTSPYAGKKNVPAKVTGLTDPLLATKRCSLANSSK